MTDKNKNLLLLLGGVLAGALVGASAALLTAPQSGLETRRMIGSKSVELKDKVVVGANETRDRAGKALDEAKTRTGKALVEAKSRTSQALVDAKSRAGEMVQTVRQKMNNKQDASFDLASTTELQ